MDSSGMTRENWEAVLADHGGPDHWFDRLAYADWLEEQGEIQEAEAWRWVVTKEKRPCDCTGYSHSQHRRFLMGRTPCFDRWVFFSGSSMSGWIDYAMETNRYGPENTLPKKVITSDHLRLDKECEIFRSTVCFSGTTHLEAEQFLVARLVCLMEAGVDVWALED